MGVAAGCGWADTLPLPLARERLDTNHKDEAPLHRHTTGWGYAEVVSLLVTDRGLLLIRLIRTSPRCAWQCTGERRRLSGCCWVTLRLMSTQ